jgi:hypothetical protein
MTLIPYLVKNLGQAKQALIMDANQIMDEYQAAGYTMTVRQLYYQMVARDLFPVNRRWRWTGRRWVRDPDGTGNAPPNYRWLAETMKDGRLNGLVHWEAIEDRTRRLHQTPDWADPQSIIFQASEQFQLDLWETQKTRVEVWVEKEALAGVFQPICDEERVPLLCCRGYASTSAMWNASVRLLRHQRDGKKTVILYFGDHDPSGIDMNRNIRDQMDVFQCPVDVRMMALTMDQVEELGPPSDPAKPSDSRYEAYAEIYGPDCWELDALEPAYLEDLVTNTVEEYRDDRPAWNAMAEAEEDHTVTIHQVADRWDGVRDFLNGE